MNAVGKKRWCQKIVTSFKRSKTLADFPVLEFLSFQIFNDSNTFIRVQSKRIQYTQENQPTNQPTTMNFQENRLLKDHYTRQTSGAVLDNRTPKAWAGRQVGSIIGVCVDTSETVIRLIRPRLCYSISCVYGFPASNTKPRGINRDFHPSICVHKKKENRSIHLNNKPTKQQQNKQQTNEHTKPII